MIREALSTFAEELIIDEEWIFEGSDKDVDTALAYLQKKYPDVKFEKGNGFVNSIFIRQKDFLITMSRDPRKPKGKTVLFDIEYTKKDK